MKKIYFIVNPISGNAKQTKELTPSLIASYFPEGAYEVIIQFTKSSGEGLIFTHDAIAKKTDIIVACGGDGTINEIASLLVNTEITLAIIPRGSGNGLATHFGIGRDIHKALASIREGIWIKMDVGKAGQRYFFSNCGTGIVAEVIHQYDSIPQRKLYGYFRAGLTSFKGIRNTKNLTIVADGANYVCKHLFVSNSSIMGYNLTLTPLASVQDGIFDLVLLPADSTFKFIIFCLYALFRKHQLLDGVKVLKAKNVKVFTNNDSMKFQIDGEALNIDKKELEITILPKALKIIIPKTQKRK